MKVNIGSVSDAGSLDSERIGLLVRASGDLSSYVIIDSTFDQEGTLSNRLRHMHRFGRQQVKSGDRVVLYTKSGLNQARSNGDGTTTYFVYWGLNETVWNRSGDVALLIEIVDSQSKRVVS